VKRILTIAGSDSGGGAGIQADLKTFLSLGCYGASAITALTAQNTIGVYGISSTAPRFVENQIRVVLEDIGADVIKLGMLFNVEIIETVSKVLGDFPDIPVVLDPVMVSQLGHPLLEPVAIAALRDLLLPRALVITPNLDEARFLAGDLDIEELALKLLDMGPQAVLIRAGHLNPKLFLGAQDYLLRAGAPKGVFLGNHWVDTRNTHGRGCTLSAAIASYLARGLELSDAILEAQRYLTELLSTGTNVKIGFGTSPVCHSFFRN